MHAVTNFLCPSLLHSSITPVLDVPPFLWLWQDDPRYRIVDPICTFVFALLVLFTTRLILADIVDVLMERVPRSLDVATIARRMCQARASPATNPFRCLNIQP